MISFTYRLWQRDRFLFLLLSIILLLVVLPLMPRNWLLIFIFELMMNLIFITAVFVSQETQQYKRAAIWLVSLAIGLGWLGRLTDYLGNHILARLLDIPGLLFHLIFLGFMILTMLKIILTGKHVTLHLINGALCIYLLIGLFFSQVYILLLTFSNAFVRNGVSMTFGDNLSNGLWLMYYSFITLATVGYGDITPVTHLASMLSAIEAITGQLFLAVIVARMVSLYVLHADTKQTT